MEKLFVTLLVWQVTAVDRLKARREAGQGALEYVGMVAVAAIVAIALIVAAKNWELASLVDSAISKVKSEAGF